MLTFVENQKINILKHFQTYLKSTVWFSVLLSSDFYDLETDIFTLTSGEIIMGHVNGSDSNVNEWMKEMVYFK